ncbi:MAG: hypothetical protein AAB209_05145 [Bacteroidota bacterium]
MPVPCLRAHGPAEALEKNKAKQNIQTVAWINLITLPELIMEPDKYRETFLECHTEV